MSSLHLEVLDIFLGSTEGIKDTDKEVLKSFFGIYAPAGDETVFARRILSSVYNYLKSHDAVSALQSTIIQKLIQELQEPKPVVPTHNTGVQASDKALTNPHNEVHDKKEPTQPVPFIPPHLRHLQTASVGGCSSQTHNNGVGASDKAITKSHDESHHKNEPTQSTPLVSPHMRTRSVSDCSATPAATPSAPIRRFKITETLKYSPPDATASGVNSADDLAHGLGSLTVVETVQSSRLVAAKAKGPMRYNAVAAPTSGSPASVSHEKKDLSKMYNFGHRYMTRHGWKPGQGLGADSSGIREPLRRPDQKLRLDEAQPVLTPARNLSPPTMQQVATNTAMKNKGALDSAELNVTNKQDRLPVSPPTKKAFVRPADHSDWEAGSPFGENVEGSWGAGKPDEWPEEGWGDNSSPPPPPADWWVNW